MDGVCDEYVDEGWCFVAVKTKVGTRKDVDPRPGQKQIDNELPTGANFDGHVQAMGFRFRTESLVVPMRLSAFNGGKLRNVVYLLADEPSRIRLIPEEYVMRQISGRDLLKNLTQPLPIRVIGGKPSDIPRSRWRTLGEERDPRPHNGVAAELFAGDLVAAKTGVLLSQHEQEEKQLANVNEALGLRGSEIDQVVGESLASERLKDIRQALTDVRDMTLTVIDGDFERDVIARENLTFARYKMPSRKNSREHYDANRLSAAPLPTGGILIAGAIEAPAIRAPLPKAEVKPAQRQVTSLWQQLGSGAFAIGLVAMTMIALVRWRRKCCRSGE